MIGSDCLFFKDFHDSLIGMLYHILADHGIAILLQPSRGGSMELFKEKSEAFFHIEQFEDYHPEVSKPWPLSLPCVSRCSLNNYSSVHPFSLAIQAKGCISTESGSGLLIRSPLPATADPSAESHGAVMRSCPLQPTTIT